MLNMDTSLEKYIDLNIITEHAHKSFVEGYSLDVSEIPPNDLSHLIDVMLANDGALREMVLEHIQTRIDERLPEVELKDRADSGIVYHRAANGDCYLNYERR